MLINQMNEISIKSINPINAPITGGSDITIYGSGFMNVIPFNLAINCVFGSIRVLALPLNDD